MFCPKCGCEIPQNGVSCSSCGLNLISYQKKKEYTAKAAKYCARCGTENTAEAAYCTECGVSFENYWKTIVLEESPAQDVQDHTKTLEQISVQSVQDLLNAAEEYNLPLEQLRFFVGKDCYEPNCCGMYKDGIPETWTVYKNRADGSRYTAYCGPSEAEAAKILFDKLLKETQSRRKSDPWQDDGWEDTDYSNVSSDSAFTHSYSVATYSSRRNIDVDTSGAQKLILRIFVGIFGFILAVLVLILLIGGFTVIKDLLFW